MKYAIISDIHANEHALRAVLDDALAHGAEKFVCLGDIVGYGPSPSAALGLVRRHCALAVAGNHDDAVCGRTGADGFLDIAGEAVKRHRRELSSGELKYLRSLPYVCEGEGFIAAHGDFTDPEKFYYIEDVRDAQDNFAGTSAQLMFVGHTHVPQISLVGASGRVYVTKAQDFTLEESKRYIVNPGSVGYPREADGRCLSSYVLYDSAERTVEFRFLPFSVSTVLQRGGGRRRTGLAWAAALGALALLAAATAPLFAPRAEKAEAERAFAGTGACESVSLDVAGFRNVSPNLKLKRSRSPRPLQLAIVFRDADGAVVGEERMMVTFSCKKRFSVPRGAASALFSLYKTNAADSVEIVSFKPKAW